METSLGAMNYFPETLNSTHVLSSLYWYHLYIYLSLYQIAICRMFSWKCSDITLSASFICYAKKQNKMFQKHLILC